MTDKLDKNHSRADPQWLLGFKTRFCHLQLKASEVVNTELLRFYWKLGADILAQQAHQNWRKGLLERLSQDLMRKYPDIKGFLIRKLEQIKSWHQFCCQRPSIAKQPASQMFFIGTRRWLYLHGTPMPLQERKVNYV